MTHIFLKYKWNGRFSWSALYNCKFLESGNQVPTNCVCDPERMALTSKNYEKGRELCLLFELEWHSTRLFYVFYNFERILSCRHCFWLVDLTNTCPQPWPTHFDDDDEDEKGWWWWWLRHWKEMIGTVLSPALRQTFNPPGFGFCSFFGRSG